MKTIRKKYRIVILCSLLIIMTLCGCKEDSIPVDNLTPDQVTKSITSKEGGILELDARNGIKIILSIPQFALEQSTTVTLRLLENTESNPFSKNLLTTIRVLPNGLKLRHAAQLKVILNSPITDTTRAILYYRKQPELAFPLSKNEVTTNSIAGETYHFSDFGGAEPSDPEIISQSEMMEGSSGTGLWDWQGFYDLIYGMLEYYEQLLMIGETQKAEELLDVIEQKIIEQVNAFLDLPVPDDPCGNYQQTLFKYAEMVMMLTSDQNLLNRVTDRLIEIRNQCWIRGEVEYDHDFTYNVEGGTVHRTITGSVPYIVNTYNNPYGEISGNGTVNWQGIEEASGCTGTETLTGNIVFDGELTADETGKPWLNFEITETYSGSITVVCPNGTATYPMSPPPSNVEVSFLMEDGYTVTRPAPGGSGNFKWILHVIYQP